jgi:hypothetical protein
MIYREISAAAAPVSGIVDAIESAWSLGGYTPFKGDDPVFLGFRWETNKNISPTRLWEGIEKEIMERNFLTPDGARIWPGEMMIVKQELSHPRAWITFERKGKSCH